MLLRTHLAITIFAIILFFPYVNYPLQLVFVALLATILPDIDSRYSKIGKRKFAKILQILSKHRGFFHSITFCLIISIILAFFLPILSFGFFLGYSLHLLADSFTKLGIRPFWPLKLEAKGSILTGGNVEKGIFFTLCIIDFLLIIVKAL